jgi:CBS domain-containing protein
MIRTVVTEVMSTPALAVAPGTPLREVARRLYEYDVGSVLVLEGAALVGIVTESDVVRSVATDGAPGTPVESVMTTDVVTVGPDASVTDACDLLREHDVNHLPVIEAGVVVGIVSPPDLAPYVPPHRLDICGHRPLDPPTP